MNEELINDIIDLIWPYLDAGASKESIRCAFDNAMDSWTPKEEGE